MKLQDVLFLVTLAVLLWVRKPRLMAWAGIGSLVLAIPLFALRIFFTAERLTWYAAAFFGFFILISYFRPHTVQ